MTSVHALGFVVILIAAAAYGLMGLVTVWRGTPLKPSHAAWVGFLVVVAAQGLVGVAIAALQSGPAEAIHWVYGGAILLVLLIGNGLAVTTLPRKRGLVMALMAALVAVLAWRLSQTG